MCENEVKSIIALSLFILLSFLLDGCLHSDVYLCKNRDIRVMRGIMHLLNIMHPCPEGKFPTRTYSQNNSSVI